MQKHKLSLNNNNNKRRYCIIFENYKDSLAIGVYLEHILNDSQIIC